MGPSGVLWSPPARMISVQCVGLLKDSIVAWPSSRPCTLGRKCRSRRRIPSRLQAPRQCTDGTVSNAEHAGMEIDGVEVYEVLAKRRSRIDLRSRPRVLPSILGAAARSGRHVPPPMVLHLRWVQSFRPDALSPKPINTKKHP